MVDSVGWPFEDFVNQYKIAYEAAVDAARDQRERVEAIRGRAVTVLSVAVAVAAFLGERLFADGILERLNTGWGPFSSLATLVVTVLALLVIAGVALFAWWPLRGTFTLSGRLIIEHYIDTASPAGEGELLRDLALWVTANVEANRRTIHFRQRALTVGIGVLTFGLVTMLLTLWDLAA